MENQINPFNRVIAGSQSKYKISKKDVTQQSSYNLSIAFMEYLINHNVIKEDNSNNEIGVKYYILNEDIKVYISSNILKLIGEDNIDINRKIIFVYTKSGSTEKFQIRRKDNKGREDLEWFKKLYDNNIEGAIFKIYYNENDRILEFDNEININKMINISFSDYDEIEYNQEIEEVNEQEGLEENVSELYNLDEDRKCGGENIIYYGVPGTGKSYQIDQQIKEEKEENVYRVTFHPEYTYNDFIGQLLPTVIKSGDNKGNITYDFQKGIFTLAMERAYKNPTENVYLIIEEMSRGNCAAIFGDIFQLLDRVKDGEGKDWSRYFVNNEVIAKDIPSIRNNRIKIPSNLYILGTVNTSDQNVFVMDTAFKRRFEWEYISTKPVPPNENGEYLNNIQINIRRENDNISIEWIKFYQLLNKFISSKEKLDLGEDKQIGQFFVEFDKDDDEINKKKIKNKLLHYLWFDIQEASYKTDIKLFDESIVNFSDLYDRYDNNLKIFSDTFIEFIGEGEHSLLY